MIEGYNSTHCDKDGSQKTQCPPLVVQKLEFRHGQIKKRGIGDIRLSPNDEKTRKLKIHSECQCEIWCDRDEKWKIGK